MNSLQYYIIIGVGIVVAKTLKIIQKSMRTSKINKYCMLKLRECNKITFLIIDSRENAHRNCKKLE